MRYYVITLALVSLVNPELTDISVWSLSTNITSGDVASDWVIKFGPLFTFCVLIDYLGDVNLPQIGATTFLYDFSPLLLDDGIYLTGLLILFRSNLI